MPPRFLSWGVKHIRMFHGLFIVSICMLAAVATAAEYDITPEHLDSLARWPLVLILAAACCFMGWINYRLAFAMYKMSKADGDRMAVVVREQRMAIETLAQEYRKSLKEIGTAAESVMERHDNLLAVIAGKPCLAGDVQSLVESTVKKRLSGAKA